MANYPSLTQLVESEAVVVDDLVFDRAVSGRGRARVFFTEKKWRFVVKHRVKVADLTTLMTFYDTNRALVFQLTWLGPGPIQNTTFDCLFEAPPEVKYLTPQIVEITTRMAEI